MKRARPKQHPRKLKNKTITVNRGIKKRVKRRTIEQEVAGVLRAVEKRKGKYYTAMNLYIPKGTLYSKADKPLSDERAQRIMSLYKREKIVPYRGVKRTRVLFEDFEEGRKDFKKDVLFGGSGKKDIREEFVNRKGIFSKKQSPRVLEDIDKFFGRGKGQHSPQEVMVVRSKVIDIRKLLDDPEVERLAKGKQELLDLRKEERELTKEETDFWGSRDTKTSQRLSELAQREGPLRKSLPKELRRKPHRGWSGKFRYEDI